MLTRACVQAATQSWLRGGADQICTLANGSDQCPSAGGYVTPMTPPKLHRVAAQHVVGALQGTCVYPVSTRRERTVLTRLISCKADKFDCSIGRQKARPRGMNRCAARAVASRRGRRSPSPSRPASATSITWSTLARKAEKARFDAFLVADHPGVTASPFVALATAAAATSKITLGTYVVNLGVRDPLQIAADVATLDVVSGGRAQLGIGAGHTPAEWTMTGTPYPSPSNADHAPDRVRARHPGSARGRPRHVSRRAHRHRVGRRSPSPDRCNAHVPLLVGGNNHRLLRVRWRARRLSSASPGSARHARRRPPARRSVGARKRSTRRSRSSESGAGARETPPKIDALVQHVEVTNNREGAAIALAQRVPGLHPADALVVPVRAHRLGSRDGEPGATPPRTLGHRPATPSASDAFDVAARLIKWLK